MRPAPAGVPNSEIENRSDERCPAPLPLCARMSCSSITFFAFCNPFGDHTAASSSHAAAFCAGDICSSRSPGLA